MNERVQRAARQLAAAVSWDADPLAAVGDVAGRPIFISDPARAPSLAACGTYVTECFGEHLAPGDAVISNDPFVGAWHVTDFTLLRRGQRGIAFARMRLPDIGGFELGGLAPQSFDTWGEGARFPALRVALAAVPRREGLELVTLNSRTPTLISNGLEAMEEVAAELCTAIDQSDEITDAPLQSAADAASRALRTLATGSYRAQAPVELPLLDDPPLVRVQLRLEHERAHISFAGSTPQLEAPVNSPSAHTLDCCLVALADALPAFPLSPGALDGVEVETALGTIAGASPPAITGLAQYHTARAIRQVLASVLREANAPGVSDPDEWWRTLGRPSFEARVDPTTLRLRQETVHAFRALEDRARAQRAREGGSLR